MTEKDNFQDFQDFAKRETISFAKEHINDNPFELLLHKQRYPDIDVEFAVQQIEGRRTASEKWQSLPYYDDYLYPPRLNREQASSEETAFHKADIIRSIYGERQHQLSIADLTGGMGIDSIAFAKMPDTEVDYVECNAELCRLMEHNSSVLGLNNIAVHCGDGIEWLRNSKKKYNVIFIDPARRDTHGKKVAAFEDCTPNILEHKGLLTGHCDFLMVKASPMMDIDKGIEQLGNVSDVYVVAVRNECKELVFVCGDSDLEARIHCTDIISGDGVYNNEPFTRSQEAQAECVYCKSVGRYIYEPDASLMKGGPYKLLSDKWGMQKLARNTHLYTSDNFHDWMGRTFCVLKEVSLNKKAIAALIPDRKAHVITRNYPVAAAELQKQLGLKEGGELYVIATTIGTQKTGLLCCVPKNYQHFLEEMNK